MNDLYFQKPKKARADKNNEAWWYASPTTIEIHVKIKVSGEHTTIIIPRRQLAHYVEKTKP